MRGTAHLTLALRQNVKEVENYKPERHDGYIFKYRATSGCKPGSIYLIVRNC
jgi:hypothetical protein